MERPIILKAHEVRGILDGRQTQLRRVVKPSAGLQSTWLTHDKIQKVPHGEIIKGGWQMHHPLAEQYTQGVYVQRDSPYGWIKCPFGQVGERLWCKERFRIGAYASDPLPIAGIHPEGLRYYVECEPDTEMAKECHHYYPDEEGYQRIRSMVKCYNDECRTRPSVQMPRWASRILLEIVSVRVERLQDISVSDCKAQGISAQGFSDAQDAMIYAWGGEPNAMRIPAFREQWVNDNGRESWASNPWVWVLEFKRVDA